LLLFTWSGNCGPRCEQQERCAAYEREDFSSHAKAPFLVSGKSRERKIGNCAAATSWCAPGGALRYNKPLRIPEPQL
jgi:hypothetical protein